ncbi:MAG: very short patch repair endonuclease [Rudaea sp.]
MICSFRETPTELRRRTMQSVKSRDTEPELRVRRYLHARGLRYRLHNTNLPGKPDVVFASRRIALFVHGCFWHQHRQCSAAKRPKTSTAYWDRKLDGNVERDAKHRTKLKRIGWRPIVIWECETRKLHKLSSLVNCIRQVAPQH